MRAKNIIRLILAVADLVNNDPDTKDILRVVFIENYSVSEAEILIPATDISEQISTAGLEASGTGNMKFMMNGAVTLERWTGPTSRFTKLWATTTFFIFGATEQEISRMERFGTYKPGLYYEQNTDLRLALNRLIDGSLHVANDRQFSDLYHSLLFGEMQRADQYYLLYDFASMRRRTEQIVSAYVDKERWKRMAAMNTKKSGRFSSTVRSMSIMSSFGI